MVPAFRDANQRWLVSAFTRVSWRDGTIEITSSASDEILRAGSILILNIIHAFATANSIPKVLDAFSQLPREEVIDCIDQLIGAGVLVTENGAEPRHWEPTALAYHQLTRTVSPVVDVAAPPDRAVVAGAEPLLIPLNQPSPPARRDFADVLGHRRSTRGWSTDEIDGSTFSTLLWMSAANRAAPSQPGDDRVASRPYPSGGAVYSLELYPMIGPGAVDSVPAGVYRYRPELHALEVLATEAAAYEPFLAAAAQAIGNDRPPVVLVISSRIAGQSEAYHRIAYSLVLKEVGGLFQTLYLVCEYLGLTSCALGGGSPDRLLTGLTGAGPLDNPVVGEFAVGPGGSGPR
jgi:SagB-type dehydrogenase family enzyme